MRPTSAAPSRGHPGPHRRPEGAGARRAGQAENILTQALGKLFAVAEAYPQLRATENFQQLQAQLAETEDKIQVSRQIYNDTTLTYNNAIQTVPTNVVAGMFSFQPRGFFEVEAEAEREAPQVSFTTSRPAGAFDPATDIVRRLAFSRVRRARRGRRRLLARSRSRARSSTPRCSRTAHLP